MLYYPPLMETLGSRIRYARKLAKLSQQQLGKALGVTREAVSQWEADDHAPTADKIGIMAKKLSVPAEWLFKGGPVDKKTGRPTDVSSDILAQIIEQFSQDERERAAEILKTIFRAA